MAASSAKAKSRATFFEHLNELRSRVILVLAFYMLIFIISYYFSSYIYQILSKPLSDINYKVSFIYTGLLEAFATKLEIAAKAAFVLSCPFASLQLYHFISPGLYKGEKQIFLFSLFAANILFIFGIAFVYFLVMPQAFHFLISFQEDSPEFTLKLHAKISEYISLVTSLAVSFGIAFQLPIFLLAAVSINIITAETLEQYRRYGIVAIFIIAGIITPPDILSQLLLALPLIFLYECTIIIAKQINKKA
ncbi:MAG: twin-arginine translocase subunit TatC, partial [Rickettsiaceae bacterium]|nr:twin-arginine translocase subunit TatC [Rickettsiaceae bacterium]